MKFNNTLLVAALTALTFAAPACGGDAKKDDKKAEEKKDEKADEKADEKKEEKKEEAPAEEPAAGGDDAKTGIPECDELMERSMKCYEKMGDAGKQAKDAFMQGAEAWKEMAKEEATKAAAADACKQALEAAKAGWEAAGC